MVRLGIPRPPGVALGDRVVHGWNPDGYAALLGVTYRAARRFSPAELASRLDRVLESAQGLIARFDARQMDHVPPERKRTLRDLAFHVFRLSLGFVDAVDRAELPESVYEERAYPELVSGGDVARYGALVRARLSGWFQGAGADEYTRTLQTKTVHPATSSITHDAAIRMRPKKKISNEVNRITSAKISIGCRSAPAMRKAPMTPKSTNATPWTSVYESTADVGVCCRSNAAPSSRGVRSISPWIASMAKNQRATTAAPMMPATTPSPSTAPHAPTSVRESA